MRDRQWPAARYEEREVQGLPSNLYTPRSSSLGPPCQQCGDIEPIGLKRPTVSRSYRERVRVSDYPETYSYKALACRRPDGSAQGPYQEYYDNGQLAVEGQFQDGAAVGTWIIRSRRRQSSHVLAYEHRGDEAPSGMQLCQRKELVFALERMDPAERRRVRELALGFMAPEP